jgi:hypothetical protein
MALSKESIEKLTKFFRLLSSDRDGEVIAAVRAMSRVLKSQGYDLVGVADKLALTLGILASGEELFTGTQLKELSDAEHIANTMAADPLVNAGLGFVSDPQGKIVFISQRSHCLSKWESTFIQSIATQLADPFYSLSPKQAHHLLKIYHKCGGT